MNLELVEKIVALLGEHPVSEISVEAGGVRVHVAKPLGSVPPGFTTHAEAPAQEAPAEMASEETAVEMRVLSAPMVGIFYHAEPPLPFGAEITPGQIVGSIESMKLMNDVAAEHGGRIVDVLVEDGAPVDYGRALFRLTAL